MALSSGVRLGAYEIVALVGAGGMGEVYRARDTRLDRTVAIKILSASLATHPQLRERFDREARAISSLSHPHVCALFDVGHENGIDFLVLEFLDGETVADRLARKGALPPAEALKVAINVCDALDKAHRAHIVHRDLKPGNVMLTKAGAKLLDFGLAKSAAPAVAASGASILPTTQQNLTERGTILGTFQYMAPEQIEGGEADARTDVFAFGALLYEMLTGRTAFTGKTPASLIGAILKDEPPPVSRVQPVAPAALDRLVSTCLAKDPDDRYQSARDLLRDLQWVASGASETTTAAPILAPAPRWARLAWVVAALSTLALIATAALAMRRSGETSLAVDQVQFTVVAPANTRFAAPRAGGTGIAAQVAVSPDGRSIVFVAGTEGSYKIWLRPIGAVTATPIQGTEGGTFPFWSPDSRSIGFFADTKLKKVQIAGGPPIVLCDAESGRGGSWNRDNVILFAPASTAGRGLMRVSSAGGAPAAVTTVDPGTGETNHRWPHFLPDGRHFLYTASSGICCPAPRPAVIRIGSLDSADTHVDLFQAESSVSYASGYLVFARDETLMAQPFDPDRLQLTGEAFPVAESIAAEGSRYVGASVSQNGTLVYASSQSLAEQPLTWFDRTGRVIGTVGDALPYVSLALSPDERRVAVMVSGRPGNPDIWIIDLARNVRSRQTFDAGSDGYPVWSPDGTRIAFERLPRQLASLRQPSGSESVSLRLQSIDASVTDESLLESTRNLRPTSWSSDGRFIAYTAVNNIFPFESDVFVLPLFGDRKPFPLPQTQFIETFGVFSPDGRWIAHTSTESGQTNVYVQSFPGPGRRHQVSRDGGSQPQWRTDGKELFYLRADGTMMAVQIAATDQFELGEPQALFPSGTAGFNSPGQMYAITKDAQRFLVNARAQQSEAVQLSVVLNWTAAIEH